MIALNRLVGISRRGGQNLTKLQKSFMTRLLQAIDGMKPLKAMALEASTRPLIEGDIRGLNKALQAIVVSREGLIESHEIIRAFAVAGGLYVFVTIWGQPVEGLLVPCLSGYHPHPLYVVCLLGLQARAGAGALRRRSG